MTTPFPMNTPLPFFGVDNEKFKLGDTVYEALEDGNDGYRSYLGSIEVRADGGIFFGQPVDTVVAVDAPAEPKDFDGYLLRSTEDGHVWLRFGTEDAGDYYPTFIFEYTPRKG